MAFPSSPANNDTFVIGNNSWTYKTATDSWGVTTPSNSGSSSTTVGDVGTYSFARTVSNLTTISSGTDYAGSGLYATGLNMVAPSGHTTTGTNAGSGQGVQLTGTWRAMGNTGRGYSGNYKPAGLFLRIS